jgi:hypothetical protein
LYPYAADQRRDPRLPPESPRLLPPEVRGDEEPPLEVRGELERGDGELTLGEGLLGADCRLTRGEGDGVERTCGIRERAGDEGAAVLGTRLEESVRLTLPEDPRST